MIGGSPLKCPFQLLAPTIPGFLILIPVCLHLIVIKQVMVLVPLGGVDFLVHGQGEDLGALSFTSGAATR